MKVGEKKRRRKAGYNCFFHKYGGILHFIDEILIRGATFDEIEGRIIEKFLVRQNVARRAIKKHFYMSWRFDGTEIIEDEKGVFKYSDETLRAFGIKKKFYIKKNQL